MPENANFFVIIENGHVGILGIIHMQLKILKLFIFINLYFRTDKWAETELGTKWGDKWEEKFFAGIGSRQGETWHVSPSAERMFPFVCTEIAS